MQEFLQKNSWGLAIGAILIIGNYYVNEFRLQKVEADVVDNYATIQAQVTDMRQTINTTDATLQQLQISAAVIERDVDYIKVNLDKILP